MSDRCNNEIHIVLVEPNHPGNIGATARAMKTMGLSSLILVRPTRFPDPQADWRAAGATDILDSAIVVDDIDAAIGSCGLVVGTSARTRRVPWPLIDPETLARNLEGGAAGGKPVAILFGRESSGLTNAELAKCQLHLQIPASPNYPTLNLAMAVQIVTYELYKNANRQADKAEWDRAPATAAEVGAFIEHLQQTLEEVGFYDPGAPRQAMTRLTRMFGRIQMDETEVAMLRGVLTHVERSIRKNLDGDS